MSVTKNLLLQEKYEHPDSPNFGSYWMNGEVSFGGVKLTNKPPSLSDNDKTIKPVGCLHIIIKL